MTDFYGAPEELRRVVAMVEMNQMWDAENMSPNEFRHLIVKAVAQLAHSGDRTHRLIVEAMEKEGAKP